MHLISKFVLVLSIAALTVIVISCKGKKNDTGLSQYKTDMLQLDLADKINPMRIQASFPNLGLKYNCTLDKSRNIVVYSINIMKYSLKDAISFLDKEVGIESAHKTKGCKKVNRMDFQDKWGKIVDKGSSNYNSLTTNERIWYNIEPLTTGGLLDHYINYGAERNAELIVDLRKLKEDEIADLIIEYNSHFNDGIVPSDINLRNKQLMKFPEEANEKLDNDYWKLNDKLERKLLNHIIKNFSN